MDDLLVNLFNFFSENSFKFSDSYQGHVIKWILIIYCLVVLLNIIIITVKHPNIYDYTFYGNKRKKTLEKIARQKKKAKLPVTAWEKIHAKLNSVNPNDWKVAIIESDKLLDQALISADTPGTTMGERLKNIVNAEVKGNLDKIWEAHNTRNNIVHDVSFVLSSDVARKTVKTLEDASLIMGKK